MGEYADMMIEGDCCQVCGQLLDGGGDGFLRTCRDCGGNAPEFGRTPLVTAETPAAPDVEALRGEIKRLKELLFTWTQYHAISGTVMCECGRHKCKFLICRTRAALHEPLAAKGEGK